MSEDKPGGSQEDPRGQWRYEPKPRGYVPPGRHENGRTGPGPKRHVVRIARADRRIDDPHPDPRVPHITGRYQSEGAAGDTDGGQYLLHVNQAGKHIEGLLVILPSKSSGSQ